MSFQSEPQAGVDQECAWRWEPEERAGVLRLQLVNHEN